MKLSIIIKALNEEQNIQRAIESSLAALATVRGGGEVILADSLSTDRTVEIATRYPVRIVQLMDAADRCCGVGAELGYRVASGEYLYILDADMELAPGFLEDAIATMERKPEVVGVGGTVEEMNVVNAEFRGRAERPPAHMSPGLVDRLNMGGLFRRKAVEAAGYLTNRNLHAFEEYELAIRLRQHGGLLMRLDRPSVRHYGHTDQSFGLLLKRWRSRYAWGLGELLRECRWGRLLLAAVTEIRLVRSIVAVWAWWAVIVAAGIGAAKAQFGLWVIVLVGVAPLLAASLRRRSLVDGVYVLAFLSVVAIGTVAGLLSPRRGHPQAAVAMRIVK